MGGRATVAGAVLAAAGVAVAAGGHRYAVRTNPLTCDYCAYDLEQALRRLPSVTGVEIDLDGIVYLQAPPGRVPDATVIRDLMLERGFEFRGMTGESP